MSTILRVEMIVLAVVIVFVIIRSINKQRIRVQYSLIWFVISLALLVVAIFPGVVEFLCRITGVQTPTNLLFLAGIFLLLLMVFHQTKILSKQSDQIKRLTQMLSIQLHRSEESGDQTEED